MTTYYVSSNIGSDNNIGNFPCAVRHFAGGCRSYPRGRFCRGHERHLYREAGRRCAEYYRQRYGERANYL